MIYCAYCEKEVKTNKPEFIDRSGKQYASHNDCEDAERQALAEIVEIHKPYQCPFEKDPIEWLNRFE
jgi:hypothetical protein